MNLLVLDPIITTFKLNLEKNTMNIRKDLQTTVKFSTYLKTFNTVKFHQLNKSYDRFLRFDWNYT